MSAWSSTPQSSARRSWPAATGHGELISVPQLLHLAAETDIIPVVFDEAGGILAYGRTRRVASPGQRRALAARDHGCSFPSSTCPPAWCEAHHVRAWIEDGTMDLANLTPLCGYHHRECARQGWDAVMINQIPHWRPPAWLDAQRKPRRNTAHHSEIHFRQPVPP